MYILFDIGGTKMRFAVTKDGKEFGEPKVVDTPPSFEEGIALIKEIAVELSEEKEIKTAVGGVAGAFNKEKSKLINSPHLHSWVNRELKGELESAFNAPVYLENDSALAGLGEAISGAGKGKDIVAYITVSTGVGGVRIVNGKIDNSAYGFEPGHQIIDFKESKYLEDLISGTAIEKKFTKRAYEVTDEKVWDELAKLLAYGLNNTIVHWSPDVVVLGGSMIVKEVGIKIPKVVECLKSILYIFPKLPEIKQASLEDFGGLYGANEIIKQQNK